MSRSVEEIGDSRASALRHVGVYLDPEDLKLLTEAEYLPILRRAERDYAHRGDRSERIRIINDAAVEHSARRAVHLQTIRQGAKL